MLNKIRELNHKRIAARREKKNLLLFDNSFSRNTLNLEYLRLWIPKSYAIENYVKKSKKLAIYSTFIGDSSIKTFSLKPASNEFNHFFISNNNEILKLAKSLNWIPVFLPIELSKNKVFCSSAAKIAKSLPHFFSFLKDYDYLLYVDDKINFDLSKTLFTLAKNIDFTFLVRSHPSLKNNILNELGEAMLQKRYFVQLNQITNYIDEKIREGYLLTPKNLFWTSAILRNNRDDRVFIINEDWYQNILICGINCQISFDFIAQKYKSIIMSNDFI
ncbi:MAG: hypothetical protein KGN31_03495 [Betaproteobacteria bacterium]|nr:hypothetical protein [Betaproteobacteria bacterium]